MTSTHKPPQKVVVIGAGVVGMTTAWHLARKGVDVTVVDKGEPGAGCSHGNGGWVSPSLATPLPAPGLTWLSLSWMLRQKSPLYIRPAALPSLFGWLTRSFRFATAADYRYGIEAMAVLGRDAVAGFEALAAEGVEFETHDSGLLVAFRSPAKHAEALTELALMAAHGVAEFRSLSRDEVLNEEPALNANHVGGVVVQSDKHVRPESLTAGLQAALEREQVTVHSGCQALGIRSEGRTGVSVQTDTGDIDGDAFVVAAGAESGPIIEACGTPLPMTAGKGYSMTLTNPAVNLKRPLTLAEAKVFMTPYEGALRVSGTLEFSGINTEVDQRRLRRIKREAEALVAIPSLANAEGWVGMRPVVPDTLPVIGQLPTRSNVYAATGHQMLGITLAPPTAAALTDLILTGSSTVDLEPFSPARF